MSEVTKEMDSLTAEERLRKVQALYHQAFAEHGIRALWNIRQFDEPTVELALSVARHLRIEGNMASRRLAEQIERLAGARK